MTKKKRLRKEQRHHRGNPPPMPLHEPDDLDVVEPLDIDDPRGDELAQAIYPLDATSDMRVLERPLLRMKRYLARHGIVPSDETQREVEDQLASGVWLHEADPEPSNPLERAQSLIYDAFESPDRDERIRLAKQALKVSKDCADAYVVLAEEASASPQEARWRYKDGVKAGRPTSRGWHESPLGMARPCTWSGCLT